MSIQNITGTVNLPPLVIPTPSPLVPDWAVQAVARLNQLTSALIVAGTTQGGYGSGAFSFSGTNAALMLPAGFTGSIEVTALTGGGTTGMITVVSGQITAVIAPT